LDAVFTAVDPRDPSIEYNWFDIGMLDYDEPTKLYLVQKLSQHGRIIDTKGQTVVNGGILDDGTYVSRVHVITAFCANQINQIWL